MDAVRDLDTLSKLRRKGINCAKQIVNADISFIILLIELGASLHPDIIAEAEPEIWSAAVITPAIDAMSDNGSMLSVVGRKSRDSPRHKLCPCLELYEALETVQ